MDATGSTPWRPRAATRLRHCSSRGFAQPCTRGDNVPHYRSRFDDAGLTPADLESLEDLAACPFTVKEDLRRNFPFGMFAVPRERVMRIHASSGTTGTPTVVGYTRADLDMWADVMARSMRAAGVRSGDLVQISQRAR